MGMFYIHCGRVTVKEPRNDDERLAALLDGKLDRRQREKLLADVAASDHDYQVLTNTASVLRRMEEEDAAAASLVQESVYHEHIADTAPVFRHIDEGDGAGATLVAEDVIPLRPRTRTRPWRRWAIAAGIAGIAAAAALVARQGSSAESVPMRLAGELNHLQGGLPDEWERSLELARGGEGSDVRAARAAHAGALLVDLSVAVQARDTVDIRELSGQLRYGFDSETSASPFQRISERPGAPVDSLQRLLSAGTERLANRLGRESLELGAWVEAARLAAHGRNGEFFRGEGAVPPSAEGLLAADIAAARALEQVRAAIPATGPPRWDELTAALDTLQAKITGG